MNQRSQQGFPKSVISRIGSSKILGIRAGREHRFTGVWVVVVNDRVFVRSWNDKVSGWHRAFLKERQGAIQIISGQEIAVRSKKIRGERLMDAIDQAYAEKYNTKASLKYVRGFRIKWRRNTTTEFVPI